MTARALLDLHPPVRQLKSLFYGVTDGVLTARTPCPGWTVADLLDHLTVLATAFTHAARRSTDAPGTSTPPPVPSAARLHPQWRGRLPALLEDLATAWADPAAWTGMAQAGGVTMPADQVGIVAVNELTLHGWDLAKATGQDFAADPRTLAVLATFLVQNHSGLSNGPDGASTGGSGASTDGPDGGSTGGSGAPFGPVVDVDDEASLLERVVALSGRDPYWRPASSRRARPT